MEKITTNEGKIVDAYSKEDVEAGATEAANKAADDAITKYKEENPDKTEELDKAQTDLKEREEELSKLKDTTKPENFEKLRKAKEGAEIKIEDLQKEMEDKLKESAETTKKEVLEGVYKDHYADELTSLAGEDDELKKRIEFEYNRLNDPAASKQEISKKIRDAWVLATKEDEEHSVLNTSVLSSGGVGKIQTQQSENKFSQEEKSMGAKFGLKDEDFDKYGSGDNLIK